MLEAALGDPDESNESWYLTGMQKVMVQLEVYDQVWAARDLAHAVQKVPGENYHSQQGINLAARIVECLEMARENSAPECYPFEMIEALKEEYWM